MIVDLSFNLSDVNVVSLNVNGLRSADKRRLIFNLLKHQKAHIILLQETHSTAEDETVWSNEWGSRIIFNHGSNFSKGVAVLFQKHIPVQIESTRCDLDGRFLILDLNISDYLLVLVNVYAPNEDLPQFYENLFTVIESRENNSLMLGGDFNTTLDPEMDLYNNLGTNHNKKCAIINKFMEDKGLVDVWRIKNPDKENLHVAETKRE